MEIVNAVLVVLGAYLLGSIPWGFIIGKWNGVDVRKVGSNNIGATNVTRCVGKKAGKLCFVLDFLKGALPVIAAQYVFRNASTVPMEYVVIAALFATVLGHMFPVFLKFKGGKGVSTAAGAVMALTPYALLAALLVLPIVAWVFYLVDFGNQLARSPEVLIFLTIVSLLAILRHHANIVRLLNGTENRFGKK